MTFKVFQISIYVNDFPRTGSLTMVLVFPLLVCGCWQRFHTGWAEKQSAARVTCCETEVCLPSVVLVVIVVIVVAKVPGSSVILQLTSSVAWSLITRRKKCDSATATVMLRLPSRYWIVRVLWICVPLWMGCKPGQRPQITADLWDVCFGQGWSGHCSLVLLVRIEDILLTSNVIWCNLM